jgi:hypothetical protein
MNQELTLKVILEKPPPGVDFGIQKGNGSKYDVIQKQRSTSKDLIFEFAITVKFAKDLSPNFAGAIVQGTPSDRFLYIDIGSYAGQSDTVWGRRLKIPLKGINSEMIDQLLNNQNVILETKVAGTGRDGGPNCGTVKPFDGWYIINKN